MKILCSYGVAEVEAYLHGDLVYEGDSLFLGKEDIINAVSEMYSIEGVVDRGTNWLVQIDLNGNIYEYEIDKEITDNEEEAISYASDEMLNQDLRIFVDGEEI